MKTLYSSSFRVRMIVVGILFGSAAALVAVSMTLPRLPWASPTVVVGNLPQTVAVDLATNTIYVPNPGDNTISIIDGRKCNSTNSSRCSSIATMTNVGFFPGWITLDSSTRTLYVINGLTENGDLGNQVAVLDVANCNALHTSGCNQPPVALVTVAGITQNDFGDESDMALDAPLHTLYVSDANFGPLSMINTATCNAHQTSGCNQVLTTTATGFGLSIDPSNHSVYVSNLDTVSVYVFNGATCNAITQSDCSAVSVAALPSNKFPYFPTIDPSTHTLYVPLIADAGDALGSTAVVNGATCNGTNHSGCGQAPQLVSAGSGAAQVGIDPSTRTVYTVASNSNTLTAINAATCNGTNHSGCPTGMPPALACGVHPYTFAINSNTHTIYVPSADTNRAWVLDTHKCNAMHTQGCTDFAPTTIIGAAPVGISESLATQTLYVSNQSDNTVSIIDGRVCNQHHLAGCNQTWSTINVGDQPRFNVVNNVTNTLYAVNWGAHTISVINTATCNDQNTANCSQLAEIPTGNAPQQIVVDQATNTLYVENQGDNNLEIIDGQHCNASDVSACNQVWPTVAVGAGPQGLGFNPINRTIYVANTNDNTVSVISTYHCNGSDTSGCAPVATVPVGAGPRAVGIVNYTNSVFIGNKNDITVSVFDGSTCNGSNTSGCPQTPPPTFVAGAFPDTGGNGNNLFGRGITFDQAKHILYMPVAGDSDLVAVDTNLCRAGHVNDCHVKIQHNRAGGFPITVTVDDATDTVYVVSNADGTVSVFPSEF